jgi:hypothetical protein
MSIQCYAGRGAAAARSSIELCPGPGTFAEPWYISEVNGDGGSIVRIDEPDHYTVT